MFTKNIKLIVFVAVLVVVALVASIAVAIVGDNQLKQQLADQNASAEADKKADAAEIEKLNATIDKLNETIAKLEQGLADAEDLAAAQEEVIKALEEAGVKLENWNGATAALYTKMAELGEAFNEWFTENEVDETGYGTLVDGYKYDEEFEKLVDELEVSTIVDMVRATSVEEMDAIIANAIAKLDAVPTRLEKLVEAINGAKVDLNKVDVYEAMRLLVLDPIADGFYAENQQATLTADYKVIAVDYYQLVISGLKADMKATPALEQITLADKDHLDDIYAGLVEIFAFEENNANFYADLAPKFTEILVYLSFADQYGDTVSGFVADYNRVYVLVDAKTEADAWNETLAAWGESTTIGAYLPVKEDLAQFTQEIIDWADKYTIPVPGHEDYVKANYDLIAHAELAGYQAEFDTALAAFRTQVETFIANVADIHHVTLDSKASLDALRAEYDALVVACNDQLADVMGELLDQETVSDVQDAHSTLDWHVGRYLELVELVKDIEEAIDALVLDTTTNTYDADAVAAIEAMILNLVGTYEEINFVDLEGKFYNNAETAIDAALLAEFKVIRIHNLKVDVVTRANGLATTTEEKGEAYDIACEVEAIVMNYAFVANEDNTGFADDVAVDALNAYTDEYIQTRYDDLLNQQ